MKDNVAIIIVVVVLLLTVAGVVVYFTVFHKPKPKPKPSGSNKKWWYCPKYPNINAECLSCAAKGQEWTGGTTTEEECDALRNTNGHDGKCVQWAKDDCPST